MKEIKREETLWEKLKVEKRPVLLYGTGNGADKILDVCIKFGIKIAGVFASADFVRDRYFRGYKVLSLEKATEIFGDDIVILLSFGTTLPEIINRIKSLDERFTLYIPCVPLYSEELFDYDFYTENYREICECESIFSDSKSKKVFSDTVMFRLTGKLEYLCEWESPVTTYKNLKNIKTAVDLGAYRGDSAADMIEAFSPERIIAAEPDPKTFAKLSAYAEKENRCEIIPLNIAAGREAGESVIAASAGRGSGENGKTKGAKAVTVSKDTVDNICENYKIDFIKYDVEGQEWEALAGSIETVKRDAPDLVVSVYHKTSDLFLLPKYIKKLCPEKKLLLRRAVCIPDWDITVLACR